MNSVQSFAAPLSPPHTKHRRVGRPRSSHLLRHVLMALIVIPVGVSLVTELPVAWFTRFLAGLLWVLCIVPSLLYLRQPPGTRRPIPFFPVISVVYGLYYVLPITIGIVDNYYNAPVYVETDYDLPVQLAFLGWIMMVAGYVGSSIIISNRRPPAELRWDPRRIARLGFLLMFLGIGAAGLRVIFVSAIVVGGVFQFLLGLQWVGTGLLIILARRGELTRTQRAFLIAGFIVSSAMMVANGSIAPMLMLFVVAGFAVWIGRPEIRAGWIVMAVIAIVLVSSLRGIAIEFRYATGIRHSGMSQSESLRLMSTILSRRVDEMGVFGTIGHGLSAMAGRSANLDLFANVARRTPSEIPYWNGFTYKSLIGLAVPRILWPNKPMKGLGQEFGHRYGFLHASNRSTSINLPVLVEFFANFGGTGVVIGMLLVGIIYRTIDTLVNRPRQSPILSMIGVALIIPLFFLESDFSLIFGGLPLSGIAFYLVWFRVRKMLAVRRRETSRPISVGKPAIVHATLLPSEQR